MITIRLAALGCLSLLAGACTPTWDQSWKSAALARDPLIHGPYLIGADRPVVGTNCVRAGSVRSQDARSVWYPCKHEVLLPPPSTPVATVEPLPPSGSYVIPEPAPARLDQDPYGVARPAPYRTPSRSRSAWDG